MDPLAKAKQLFLDGLALQQKGELVLAARCYVEALKLAPERPSVMNNLSAAYIELNRYADAMLMCERVLAINREDETALLNLSSCQMKLGLTGDAITTYRSAVAVNPDNADALNNLGAALLEMKRPQEALESCERALTLKPDFAEAHYNRGKALRDLRQLQEALASYDRALALKPEFTDAFINRGNILLQLDRPQEALASYDFALTFQPERMDALIGRGSALLEQGKFRQAAEQFERVIAMNPVEARGYAGLGTTRRHEGILNEAATCFERAHALDPNSASAQYGLGLVRLFRHEFAEGWPLYEERFETEGIRENLRNGTATLETFGQLPRWTGLSDAATVGIWAEQGIGDQLLFSTLIPELIGLGVPFIYEVDRRLLDAYARAFPGGRFVALEDPPQAALQEASRVLMAGSLPGLFRRSRESFARQPRQLLAALPERIASFRDRMEAEGAGPRVALSWRSTRKGRMGLGKSVALSEFAPLLSLDRIQFVDVQYGDTAAERKSVEQAMGVRLQHFDDVDYYNDLEDVLAILEACDLLVTVSNATAHFAGALGKRTWLLYRGDNPPFHYWAHGGSFRSLWYPSVELVTAAQFTDWPALIGHVAQRLQRELAPPDRGPASGVRRIPRGIGGDA